MDGVAQNCLSLAVRILSWADISANFFYNSKIPYYGWQHRGGGWVVVSLISNVLRVIGGAHIKLCSSSFYHTWRVYFTTLCSLVFGFPRAAFWFRTPSTSQWSHTYIHTYDRLSLHRMAMFILPPFNRLLCRMKSLSSLPQPFDAALMTRLAHGKPTSQLPCRFNSAVQIVTVSYYLDCKQSTIMYLRRRSVKIEWRSGYDSIPTKVGISILLSPLQNLNLL